MRGIIKIFRIEIREVFFYIDNYVLTNFKEYEEIVKERLCF